MTTPCLLGSPVNLTQWTYSSLIMIIYLLTEICISADGTWVKLVHRVDPQDKLEIC